MSFFGVCERCGEPVVGFTGRADREPAFPVVGWEVLRAAGGTNHIRNRTRVPDRVRHVGCLPGGVPEEQESLL